MSVDQGEAGGASVLYLDGVRLRLGTLLKPRRIYLGAALAVLASGGCMLASGYVLGNNGVDDALLLLIPGGLLISAAFAAVETGRQRSQGHRRAGKRQWVRQVLPVLTGLPWPSGDVTPRARAATFLLAMTSGAAMVFAGFAADRWNWLLAVPLVFLGGLLIVAAVTVGA